jgi:hypothetical protein
MEDGHERERGILFEHSVEIAHAQKHGEHHGETKRTVDGDAGHDGARYNDLCVMDFLR